MMVTREQMELEYEEPRTPRPLLAALIVLLLAAILGVLIWLLVRAYTTPTWDAHTEPWTVTAETDATIARLEVYPGSYTRWYAMPQDAAPPASITQWLVWQYDQSGNSVNGRRALYASVSAALYSGCAGTDCYPVTLGQGCVHAAQLAGADLYVTRKSDGRVIWSTADDVTISRDIRGILHDLWFLPTSNTHYAPTT
jgi:hypothetical protein